MFDQTQESDPRPSLEAAHRRALAARRAFRPSAEPLAARLAASAKEVEAATSAGDVDALVSLQQRHAALESIVARTAERDAESVASLDAAVSTAGVALRRAQDAHDQRVSLLLRRADSLRAQVSTQEQTLARTNGSPGASQDLRRSREGLAVVLAEIASLTGGEPQAPSREPESPSSLPRLGCFVIDDSRLSEGTAPPLTLPLFK
jgi:hypothetical protein